MQSYWVQDGSIIESNYGEDRKLSKHDLIKLLDSDKDRENLACSIPSLILDTAYYLSSIKVRVFISEEKRKLPYFVFIISDSLFYSEIEVKHLPEGYLVINDMLLLLDDDLIANLEKLVGKESSIVPYKKLSELYLINDLSVEFVADDSRCVSYDSIEELRVVLL